MLKCIPHIPLKFSLKSILVCASSHVHSVLISCVWRSKLKMEHQFLPALWTLIGLVFRPTCDLPVDLLEGLVVRVARPDAVHHGQGEPAVARGLGLRRGHILDHALDGLDRGSAHLGGHFRAGGNTAWTGWGWLGRLNNWNWGGKVWKPAHTVLLFKTLPQLSKSNLGWFFPSSWFKSQHCHEIKRNQLSNSCRLAGFLCSNSMLWFKPTARKKLTRG